MTTHGSHGTACTAYADVLFLVCGRRICQPRFDQPSKEKLAQRNRFQKKPHETDPVSTPNEIFKIPLKKIENLINPKMEVL
jgi:hypothetical protein